MCNKNPGTLPRFPVYSELQLHVASKYSFFNFGTFYIVGGRRLLITESLSRKDTISGRSESSTYVLSKHMGENRDQLCKQMKPMYTLHIHPMQWADGSGAGLKAPISKRRLIIINAGNSTLNSLY